MKNLEVWSEVLELTELEILQEAIRYGYWSPNWIDETGSFIMPDVPDLRTAIYDVLAEERP